MVATSLFFHPSDKYGVPDRSRAEIEIFCRSSVGELQIRPVLVSPDPAERLHCGVDISSPRAEPRSRQVARARRRSAATLDGAQSTRRCGRRHCAKTQRS
jgi:hypothetical protein